MSPHDSQFIQKRTFANPSKFLWTLRSTDWKWTAVALRSTDWKRTAVDRRRGITAAEGHGASKSTGWPRQRWTKSPRLRQLAELKETNKKKSGACFCTSWCIFRCCRNILDLVVTSTNMLRPLLGSSRAFDFVWLCHLRDLRTHDHCTRQASGMTCVCSIPLVFFFFVFFFFDEWKCK